MRYRRVDVGPCPRSRRLQLGPRPPHTCYVLRPAGKAEGPGGMWGPAVITYQPFSTPGWLVPPLPLVPGGEERPGQGTPTPTRCQCHLCRCQASCNGNPGSALNENPHPLSASSEALLPPPVLPALSSRSPSHWARGRYLLTVSWQLRPWVTGKGQERGLGCGRVPRSRAVGTLVAVQAAGEHRPTACRGIRRLLCAQLR